MYRGSVSIFLLLSNVVTHELVVLVSMSYINKKVKDERSKIASIKDIQLESYSKSTFSDIKVACVVKIKLFFDGLILL